ncbi:MAG: hypothetical protein A2Z20_11480 [Bdellovibrionales bacterium RBG_16_40_8]|nr:MAG: hypothetical protein A2Z20_11480 [Bdellovibrionales bacterium RBG_16_40_8]
MLANALVLLGAAILVATIFHSMKLPPIVAFISAGVLVGPSGFGLISSMPQVDTLTEIAAMLLMFTIGLEFSFKDLANFRRALLVLGVGQVLLTISLFTILFWLAFSMPIEKAIFVSFLVAPSSTAVVLKLLYDNRDFESPYGKATFSILLLQDLAIIPMIVAIPFLVSTRSVTTSIFDSILPVLLLISLVGLLFFILSKYVLPYIFYRVSQTRNREIFFFSVLFIFMGTATLLNTIGLSLSLGAFLAGMLLSGSHYSKQATAEILPLRDSFMSLFFVAIGMMLDLKFLFNNFHQILLLGLLVVALKSLIIFSVTWFSGNTGSVARAVTALLFQFGEFSFILAELGVKNQLLREREQQIFVAISIASLTITPLLYSRLSWFMHNKKLDSSLPASLVSIATSFRERLKTFRRPLNLDEIATEKMIENHVIIIGFGVAGQSLCRVLHHLKIPFQVIEINAETVRIHANQIPIVFGDAANPQLLKKVGIEKARLVVVVTSGINMLEPVYSSIKQLNPTVRVIARTNYIQDLQRFKQVENTKFIVSELETTLKLISETMHEFKIEETLINDVVNELRKEL